MKNKIIKQVKNVINKLNQSERKFIQGPKTSPGTKTYYVRDKETNKIKLLTQDFVNNNKHKFQPVDKKNIDNNKDKIQSQKNDVKIDPDIDEKYLKSDQVIQLHNNFTKQGHDVPKVFQNVFPKQLQSIINSYINLGAEKYKNVSKKSRPPGGTHGTATLTQLFSMCIPFVEHDNQEQFATSMLNKIKDTQLSKNVPRTPGKIGRAHV